MTRRKRSVWTLIGLLVVVSIVCAPFLVPYLASAQDTTPPVISDVQASNVTATSATIGWTTNETSDSVVNYGTTTLLGSTGSNSTLVTDHLLDLTGLTPLMTYYYEVQSTDAANNTATDDNSGAYYTFITGQTTSLSLTGWGWCPDRRGIPDAAFSPTVIIVPRGDASGVSDISFIGNLTLTYPDDPVTFSLDLTGVKVRSLFYLRQHEVSPDGTVWEAALRGTWLTWEEDGVDKHYVSCEADIQLAHGDLLKTVKPYFFLLRTPDADIPGLGEPGGGYLEKLDYILGWVVRGFNGLITQLASTNLFEILGDVLDRATVIIGAVRAHLEPYIP